ncbi:MAG: cysteine--tRNA ligase, partial [Aigarchaeota archaeon]|nr:cysteine--tRNA ligase [Aigarchaeota archaeon]
MGLRLYNTLSRKVEDFRPLEEGRVKIFVCGTTEQDFVHLGHGRTYAFYDTLVRFLKHLGYDVFYIQNITDVGHLTDDADQGEDKILLSARKEGKHPMEIVDYFIKEHLEAADKLRLARPNIMPRATGHLPEIIEQVRTLLEKGYAYEVNGSVYYDISKFEDYGKLSRVNVEEMLSGARVDVREEKRNPRDFALWINAPRGHVLRWPSPWGEGYPGWHIEDTAIAIKYFGPQYDIHGGAIELAFPHHEAEIAQAEATTGVKPYVRYWVHTGLLTIMGEKMAKSKGNYIKLIDALEQYGAEALRLWMASAHYRQPVDYSEEALQAAQKNIKKISQTLRRITQSLEDAPRGKSVFAEEVKELEKRFMDAMMDDMNTP